jgi:hypothetical protein
MPYEIYFRDINILASMEIIGLGRLNPHRKHGLSGPPQWLTSPQITNYTNHWAYGCTYHTRIGYGFKMLKLVRYITKAMITPGNASLQYHPPCT